MPPRKSDGEPLDIQSPQPTMSFNGALWPPLPLRETLRSSAKQHLCRRCLHTSRTKAATPLPVTAHGPPPKAPLPTTSKNEDRIARRKDQAEILRQAQALRSASKPGSGIKKRFWKHVSVQDKPDGLQIHLDNRAIRTPSKTVLNLPKSKRQLAFAIALEWDLLVSAQQALKQHLIPLTSLVSRAEDIKGQDSRGQGRARDEIVDMVMRYLDTDTLLCWAPASTTSSNNHPNLGGGEHPESKPRSLRDLQQRSAQPIINFLTTHVWPGADIHPVADSNSILPASQPQMTKDIIRGWVTGLPAYELTGLERAVLATKSLLVASRFLAEWSPNLFNPGADGEEHVPSFGVDEAEEAATLEVRWQTDMWGEVEDTHDVDREDVRRQLGSVVLLVTNDHV